jgi:ATP-dependent DNA ligase
MLGALELESEDGRVKVSVGSGFTDDDRMSITESIIGSIITVQYNQLIENKNGGISLYLPRFVEIRDDKEVADTLDKIKRNG